MKVLSKTLNENDTLKVLEFHFCRVEEEGALAIADALRVNTRLVRLILKSNPIKNYGCMALLSALKDNTSLIVINLEDC